MNRRCRSCRSLRFFLVLFYKDFAPTALTGWFGSTFGTDPHLGRTPSPHPDPLPSHPMGAARGHQEDVCGDSSVNWLAVCLGARSKLFGGISSGIFSERRD